MIPVKMPATISTIQIETWNPAASGLTPTEPDVDVADALPEMRRGEPGGGVGPHRVEGDVAEVEEARVPDDDVQADRHHDEDRHRHGRVDGRERAEERDLVQVVPVVRVE